MRPWLVLATLPSFSCRAFGDRPTTADTPPDTTLHEILSPQVFVGRFVDIAQRLGEVVSIAPAPLVSPADRASCRRLETEDATGFEVRLSESADDRVASASRCSGTFAGLFEDEVVLRVDAERIASGEPVFLPAVPLDATKPPNAYR